MFIPENIYKVFSEIAQLVESSDNDLIDEYALIRGGVFNDKSFEYATFKILGASLMRGYSEIKFERPIPTVYTEIVNEDSLNAVAIKTREKDTFIIFVNKKLINEIDLFLDKFIKSKYNEYSEEYSGHISWLRGLFYQVIVEHELSHIFNGHLGLLEEILNTNKIDENSSKLGDVEKKFLMQTLEMDADCTALSRLYGWLYNLSKVNSEEIIEYSSSFLINPVQSFSDLMMAFYTINKFFHDLSSLSKEIGESTHETPRERVMASFGNLLLNIQQYKYDVDLQELKEEVMKKIAWVEIIFKESYGVPLNSEFWDNEEYLYHTEVTKKVLMHWESIQPSLLKYNYLPISEAKRDLKLRLKL